MNLENVFQELASFEKSGETSITIDDDGVYKYLFNSPVCKETIKPELDRLYGEKERVLYVVPRDGDLVLTIELRGEFTRAILYQYDWTGGRQVVYAQLDAPGVMNPFPSSGFPLLQCGKALYMDVYDPKDVKVEATYAFLETASRQLLARYVHPTNKNHGVKSIHANGDTYQAVFLSDWGYSPNVFELIEKK